MLSEALWSVKLRSVSLKLNAPKRQFVQAEPPKECCHANRLEDSFSKLNTAESLLYSKTA